MRKYFCDSCGNEVEQIMLGKITIVSPGLVSKIETFEVCEKCLERIENTLESDFFLNKETA